MQKQYAEEEIEIDLRELLFEFISHWKLILLSTVMVGGIAFVISMFLLTPQYESTAELYVLSKSTSITSLADIQMGTSLTNDYIVTVKGRPVIEQVIHNLDLNETYKSLSARISINNPSNSRILEIIVKDPDPELAKKIADETANVASAFIAEKMQQDPPTVIQYGYADGEAVSPSISKNTLIGAIVGMLIACALITVSYLMNDTIMTADDVEKKLGMNLLGQLPYEAEAAENDGKKHKKSRKTGADKKSA